MKDPAKEPDPYTGLYKNSQGGTELMYRQLTSRLDPRYLERFQIICSRFREFAPGKTPLYWLHDMAEDPEVVRLADVGFRSQFRKLIFVSDWQFNQYNMRLRVPFSGSVIIKNAIEPLPACEKPRDRLNLIYHTTPHRGLEILVPVFVEMARHFPELHLDVFSSFEAYGASGRDRPYTQLFEICQNHPQITYHGFQSNEVVREALLKAHIFAYPCIWKETSCIAAMEAMSAGVLVACPNLAVLPETVNAYGAMYHFEENAAMHARIFYQVLYRLVEQYRSQGPFEVTALAKERIDRLFSWDVRIREWKDLLSQL